MIYVYGDLLYSVDNVEFINITKKSESIIEIIDSSISSISFFILLRMSNLSLKFYVDFVINNDNYGYVVYNISGDIKDVRIIFMKENDKYFFILKINNENFDIIGYKKIIFII